MTKRWTKIDFFKVGQSDMIPPQDKAEATVDHTAACRRVWGQRWTGRCDAYQHGPVTCVIWNGRFRELITYVWDVTRGFGENHMTSITRSAPAISVPALAAAPSSDESLIKRIASGDKLAMQVLYARHHVRVFRFVVRIVHDESMAEDLISEVFLDVWRQADRFEGRSAVSTWLMSIARFKALSARRGRKDAELDDKIEATIADPADDPAVTLEKKNQSELLRHALTKLSAEHREIIDLVYYHEQSIDEAAQVLGIPAATVKTRMFYARKKLGEWLKVKPPVIPR